MNQTYQEQVSNYQKKDALIAILLLIVTMVIYTVFGLWGGLWFGLFLSSIIGNLLVLSLCLGVVLLRKEALSSVGLGARNMLPALGFGLLLGVIPFLLNNGIVPGLLNGWQPNPIGQTLIEFCYQLFIIAFYEEIFFRGYLQTRLYGLFKKNGPAMAVGAILFSLFHVPFQLASGSRALDVNFLIWLLILVIMHLVFNAIYRKHTILWGVILFHAFQNTSNGIFAAEESKIPWSYISLAIVIGMIAIAYMIQSHGRKKDSPDTYQDA